LPAPRTARDRMCALREDQRLALRPAATSERERGGGDATIACGGGGWEVREGRMRALVQVQDVEVLHWMIDVDWGAAL